MSLIMNESNNHNEQTDFDKDQPPPTINQTTTTALAPQSFSSSSCSMFDGLLNGSFLNDDHNHDGNGNNLDNNNHHQQENQQQKKFEDLINENLLDTDSMSTSSCLMLANQKSSLSSSSLLSSSTATSSSNVVDKNNNNQTHQLPTGSQSSSSSISDLVLSPSVKIFSQNLTINNHDQIYLNEQNAKAQYKRTLDYLKELFQDRERLNLLPFGMFFHLRNLIESEIQRVRASLIHIDGSADQRSILKLPQAEGPTVQKETRIFIPVEKYPDYNFVGRIIGPRGLTIRELETDCGCKFYIRGRGSLRSKEKEERCRTMPNWEHLNEELHVLIVVEDSENRVVKKLEYAVQQINKLIDSVIEQKDDFKMRQLAELAILNDKFNAKLASNLDSAVNKAASSLLPAASALSTNAAVTAVNSLSNSANVAQTPLTFSATPYTVQHPAAYGIQPFASFATTLDPFLQQASTAATNFLSPCTAGDLLGGLNNYAAMAAAAFGTPATIAMTPAIIGNKRFHPYKK